jgi:chromate transporter
LARIFWAFLVLGCTSFGGGTAGWLYREMVLRRHWIDDRSFLPMLSLAQVMPGANGIQLTVLIGQRMAGAAGAVTALAGLLAGPFAIVLALGTVYAGLSGYKLLHEMLDGVAAAVIGLTFATGLRNIARNYAGPTAIALTVATVLAVGVMGWPILPAIAVLAPVSIGLALAQGRRG